MMTPRRLDFEANLGILVVYPRERSVTDEPSLNRFRNKPEDVSMIWMRSKLSGRVDVGRTGEPAWRTPEDAAA